MPSRFLATLIALTLIGSISFGAQPPYSDIEIISSDNSQITFRLNLAEPSKYIAPILSDSSRTIIRTVLIGVPFDASPTIISARGEQSMVLPEIDDARFRSYDLALSEIVQSRMIRGKKVITVNLYPYYRGILYGQVEVAISFNTKTAVSEIAGTTSSGKIFDKILQYSVLNHEQFQNWAGEPRRQLLAKPAQNPFSAADTWYKISTINEGLVKVMGQSLQTAGLPLTNLYSDSLHLFYGGGMPLSVLNNQTQSEFREIPIMIYDGGDGRFGAADYILFYSDATDRWRYPSDSAAIYLENPYTATNCYWLAVSGSFGQKGLRIDSVSGTPAGTPDTSITEGLFNVRVGQNRLLEHDSLGRISDYYNWYWTDTNQFTFYVLMPQAISSISDTIRMRAKANGVSLMVNNYSAAATGATAAEYRFVSSHFFAGLNRVSLVMGANSYAPPHFDYCEVAYVGALNPSSDQLDFAVGSISGTAEIIVNNQFSTAPLIFDLTDPISPHKIINPAVVSGELRFQYQPNISGRTRFYLCAGNKTYQASAIEKRTSPQLTDNNNQYDMIIIGPEQFLAGLDDYKSYREQKSGIKIQMVPLADILNEFSYGLDDPTAIREFLKYAYDNYPAPAPSAVLLVGDGNYDYRKYLKMATQNYVMPYIHSYDSTASDDNYVYFGKYGLLDYDTSFSIIDRGYDMMIARWPVRDLSELGTIIDKVKSYEASTNFGPWRSTVTLVADDEFGNYDTESFHVRYTEELEKYHLPAAFARNKIYLWDYPFNSLRAKPEVNAAIVKSINDGTLLVNYTGHGNPDTWAHEHVFNRNTDLTQLHNSEKLPLIFTASCSIGFFDDPAREGMAEELVRLSGAGAIATLAATRLVYAGENAEFNQQIYDVLFGADTLSICQAIFIGKVMRQYGSGQPRPIRNDRPYSFFGDPFLELGVPRYEINFTERPDSLTALAQHDVAGEITVKNSSTHVSMDGEVDIVIYDSEIKKYHKVYNGSGGLVDSVNYALNGPAIYRGSAPITDGSFSFSFIAPLDIGFGGKGAKISLYAKSALNDGFGLIDSIPVSLSANSGNDTTGPSIAYNFGTRQNFVSGDRIQPNEALQLTLSDSAGLNLTGSAGHGITLVVDDRVENSTNLTDLFQYNTGSYTTGQITYNLGMLTSGVHKFKTKVWDNANNSSVVEFTAEVVESGKLMIADLLNYPNPMKEVTTFSFALTSSAGKVSLEIFTLSGRKIKSIEKNSVSADYHEFCSWDGRDSDGDRVATGVYIYKLTAVSENSGEAVESFGKVVVVN
jgi:hypothetical protein